MFHRGAAHRDTTCPDRDARRLRARTSAGGRARAIRREPACGAVGDRVPLFARRIIESDEGGFASHREAHVAVTQQVVDALAQSVDALPLGVRERPGRARVFVDPTHGVVERELDLNRLGGAGDGRGARRVRCRRQWDVTFASEQRARRVQADPSRAGNINLRPSVQIGEIGLGAARAIEDFSSAVSWIRYPETKRAARPYWRSRLTRSHALSRQEPIARSRVSSGFAPPAPSARSTRRRCGRQS